MPGSSWTTRVWHADAIRSAREGAQVEAARDRLATEADDAIDAGPFSVRHAGAIPPSGDEHDYLSQGPYWWPNPDTDDGLPYVRRDGERNPEVDDLDKPELTGMLDAVETLSLAGYVLEESAYADRTGTLLRTWFLDPETLMNPNLRYAQRIPSRTEGRGIGIIDTHRFPVLCDAIELVRAMQGISAEEYGALREWFESFLEWLFESDNGRDESAHPNNHGTWYDAQTLGLAEFVGREETARCLARTTHVGERHVAAQIEEDGRQPEELSRTRPHAYSVFNLRGLTTLARLYESVDADLWTFEKRYGGSIRLALDWLGRELDDRAWDTEGDDLLPFPVASAVSLYLRAASAYNDPEYARVALGLPGTWEDHRARLVYPEPPSPR
ncbi:MAG: alginate lyase family protein [Halobacteriales archaeon]